MDLCWDRICIFYKLPGVAVAADLQPGFKNRLHWLAGFVCVFQVRIGVVYQGYMYCLKFSRSPSRAVSCAETGERNLSHYQVTQPL